MKVTIITAALNNAGIIGDCIESVAAQTYSDREHIIIDGGSTDGTLAVIEKYRAFLSKVISEPDYGIYDAMNKGIKNATGDIVGILNSDDVYENEFVVEEVVESLEKSGKDICYGDLLYVDRWDVSRIIRVWNAGLYSKEKFIKGWMPPHPTFFVKRGVYERYGLFNLDFPVTADYELMLRFLYKYNVSTAYIPKVLVRMRTGGKSKPGLFRIIRNMEENYRAWKVNGLDPNLLTFVMKPLSKAVQYVKAR